MKITFPLTRSITTLNPNLIYSPLRSGNYIFGWFGDFFRLAQFVREANNDPAVVERFKEDVQKRERPGFEFSRVSAGVAVGYLWAQVFYIAVPVGTFFGCDYWAYLYALVPAVVALGVWTAGNVGRRQGKIWHCLVAAYAAYPLRFLLHDKTAWLMCVVITSAVVFDLYSKEWQLTPSPRRSLKRRVFTLYVCGVIYLSLLVCWFCFNGSIPNDAGELVPVHKAFNDALSSDIWRDLKKHLANIWMEVKYNGVIYTYWQLLDTLDIGAEARALSTLGLPAGSTPAQISSRFRKISKELHPDKVKGTFEEKRRAQEQYMKLSVAYEKLNQLRGKSSKQRDEGGPINL